MKIGSDVLKTSKEVYSTPTIELFEFVAEDILLISGDGLIEQSEGAGDEFVW